MTATVRAASAGELAAFRSDLQYTKIRALFIPQPEVMRALLNGAPSTNESVTNIFYDNVTVGNYGNIQIGMTLYVYTAAGAYAGMARIRGAASNQLIIGRCSDIQWVDNMVLSVVEDFGLWGKLAKQLDNETIVLDDDEVYVDQNVYLQPVPIMGSDMAVPLASGSIAFDSSNSYTLDGSTITARDWTVYSGSASVFTSGSVSPVFNFSTAGLYQVRLAVTASNTKTTIGHRTLYVYNDTDPEDQMNLLSMGATVNDGGWSAQIQLWEGADVSQVKDRSKVILLAQDYYGGSSASYGQVAGQEHVLMVGWIDGNSIEYDREVSSVTFNVESAKYWIDKIVAPSTALATITNEVIEGVDQNNSWFFAPSWNIDKIMAHFFYWRSTVMEVMDVYNSGNTTQMEGTIAGIASIWAQVNQPVSSRMLMRMGVDRYGRYFLMNDPQLLPTASRTGIVTVQALTGDDFGNKVDIKRVVTSPLAMVNIISLVGISTDTIAMSRAPGALVYKRYGENKSYENCQVNNQDEANVLSGMLLAKGNNEYPEITVELAENNRMFDIVPAMYATMSVSGSQNARGISFTNMKCLPKRIDYNIDAEKGYLTVQMVLEGETSGAAGVTVTMPPEPIWNFPVQPVVNPIEIPITPIVIPGVLPIIPDEYIPRIIIPPTTSGSVVQCFGSWDALITPGEFYTTDTVRSMKSFRCAVRPISGSPCVTRYELTGQFQSFLGTVTSGSVWKNVANYGYTNTDNFYNVYGVNASGSRVCTFTHDPISGSGYSGSGWKSGSAFSGSSIRTGYYAGSSAVNIEYIEVGMVLQAPMRMPTGVTMLDSFFNFMYFPQVSGSMSWGINDSGVWIKHVNMKSYRSISEIGNMIGLGIMYRISGSTSSYYNNTWINVNYTTKKRFLGMSGSAASYWTDQFLLQNATPKPWNNYTDLSHETSGSPNVWDIYGLYDTNKNLLNFDRRTIGYNSSGSVAYSLKKDATYYQNNTTNNKWIELHRCTATSYYSGWAAEMELFIQIKPTPSNKLILGGLTIYNVDASPTPVVIPIDVGD